MALSASSFPFATSSIAILSQALVFQPNLSIPFHRATCWLNRHDTQNRTRGPVRLLYSLVPCTKQSALFATRLLYLTSQGPPLASSSGRPEQDTWHHRIRPAAVRPHGGACFPQGARAEGPHHAGERPHACRRQAGAAPTHHKHSG